MSEVRLPGVFFDDHRSRDLDTPKVLREKGRHVWVAANDPAIPELLSDAEYYADAYGPDVDIGLKSSARATVKALRTIPNIEAMCDAWDGDGQKAHTPETQQSLA